ncbi:MAG: hypothetical protein L6R36_002920 [Xanthoria steineri]|nr:MAG: hypothetical protein L6R36_002920 [Xanthoria steineri]
MSWNTGTVLITGAAGGIGEETAFAFAEAGVSAIAFADLDEQKAGKVAEKSKSLATNSDYRTIVLAVDVTDPTSVQRMVDETVRVFGRIDYNVNAAGIDNDSHTPIFDTTIEDFDKVMNINARGVLTCTRAVSKAMLAQDSRHTTTRSGTRDIGRGSIVNLGSANSYAAIPGKVAYVASKHAVMGITKASALDCATQGVRVNAVCPTWVRTPMFEEECTKNPQLQETVKALSPLGRAAEPDEIAGAVLFLCGPAASYVTGTGLVIDAGLTLTVHMT